MRRSVRSLVRPLVLLFLFGLLGATGGLVVERKILQIRKCSVTKPLPLMTYRSRTLKIVVWLIEYFVVK